VIAHDNAPEWTTEQWVEHGRAWVRAGLWTWAPGQVAFALSLRGCFSIIITDVDGDGVATHGTGTHLHGVLGGLELVPDMRDPGTRGHALEQIWNDRTTSVQLSCESTHDGIYDASILVETDDDYFRFGSPGVTRAEAIAPTLLAARRAAR